MLGDSSILTGPKKGIYEMIRTLFALVLLLQIALHADVSNTVSRLFQNPEIATSRELLEEAGFSLYSHNHRGICIAEHPELPGYLIKLFINDAPREFTLNNFMSRIEGANQLREFIKKNKLTKIVVPQKQLYTLQDGTPLLVVEKMDIIDSTSELEEAYASIDLDLLEELCKVVKRFRGLDSILKNMPFTRDGKIAFIDTEKWKSPRSGFLHYVRPLLDDEQNEVVSRYYENAVDSYLMPKEHPAYGKLNKLFTDVELFDSPEALRENGFEVNKRVHQKLMVFTHPSVDGYIFKRFKNSVDNEKQKELYLKRLKGASLIRRLIKKNGFQHVVAPKKWLFALPDYDDEYVVVAERFDICPGDDHPESENVARYKNIEPETLKEYCMLMRLLGGCDAWPRNQPFTKDGKIAFIDTEHVGQKEAHFHRHILPLLDPLRQELAMQWFLGN